MATGVEPHEPALVHPTQAYPTFVLLDTAARPENVPDVDAKAARLEAVLLRDPVGQDHIGPGAADDAMDGAPSAFLTDFARVRRLARRSLFSPFREGLSMH